MAASWDHPDPEGRRIAITEARNRLQGVLSGSGLAPGDSQTASSAAASASKEVIQQVVRRLGGLETQAELLDALLSLAVDCAIAASRIQPGAGAASTADAVSISGGPVWQASASEAWITTSTGLRTAITAVLHTFLGPEGAQVAPHLSEHAPRLGRWLNALLTAAKLARQAAETMAWPGWPPKELVQLSALWRGLRGVAGLQAHQSHIRRTAVEIVGELHAAGLVKEGQLNGLPLLEAAQLLLIQLASEDPEADIRAKAVTAGANLVADLMPKLPQRSRLPLATAILACAADEDGAVKAAAALAAETMVSAEDALALSQRFVQDVRDDGGLVASSQPDILVRAVHGALLERIIGEPAGIIQAAAEALGDAAVNGRPALAGRVASLLHDTHSFADPLDTAGQLTALAILPTVHDAGLKRRGYLSAVEMILQTWASSAAGTSSPAPAPLPAQAATVTEQIAERLLGLLASPPPRGAFADVDGVPRAAEAAQQPAATEFREAAASALGALAALVSRSPPRVPRQAPDTAAEDSPRDRRTEGLAGGVLIEELEADVDAPMPDLEAGGTIDCVECVLVCSTFGSDEGLSMPWTSAGLSASAMHVLDTIAEQNSMLAELTGVKAAALSSAKRSGGPGSGNHQSLLLAILPEAVRRLRAQAVQQKSPVTARLTIEAGPDTFERAVAAAKLAWLVRQLDYQGLSRALPVVLPTVLAVVDDTSPVVQSYGLWTMHHVASEAIPNELRWQRPLLLDVAKRSISGCDDAAWPAAAAAAAALVICLEGKDPFANGYAAIMEEMLTEGERLGHKRARRLVWLEAMHPILQAMGLANIRYFARLLPLLLQWTDAVDRPTRLAAVAALDILIPRTWPRVRAHSAVILSLAERGQVEAQQSDQGTMDERMLEIIAWRQLIDKLKLFVDGVDGSCETHTAFLSKAQEC